MEQNNIEREKVVEIIKSFPFKPNWGKLVITLNQEQEEGINFDNAYMSGKQFVIATGDRTFAKPGDEILVDISKLTVQVPDAYDNTQTITQLKVEAITVDDTLYGLISDNVVLGKYDFEDIDLQA